MYSALFLVLATASPQAWAQSPTFLQQVEEIDRRQGIEGVTPFLNAHFNNGNVPPALDFLKAKVQSGKELRYGFLYAFMLERIGTSGAQYKELLATATMQFFMHFMWLRQDAARCADKTVPEAVIPSYAKFVRRFTDYYKELRPDQKQVIFNGLKAMNDMSGRRPVNQWACARGMDGMQSALRKGLTRDVSDAECRARNNLGKCTDVLDDPAYVAKTVSDASWAASREAIYRETFDYLKKH